MTRMKLFGLAALVLMLSVSCATLPEYKLFDCDDPDNFPPTATGKLKIVKSQDPVPGSYIVELSEARVNDAMALGVPVLESESLQAVRLRNTLAAQGAMLGGENVVPLGVLNGFAADFSDADIKRLARIGPSTGITAIYESTKVSILDAPTLGGDGFEASLPLSHIGAQFESVAFPIAGLLGSGTSPAKSFTAASIDDRVFGTEAVTLSTMGSSALMQSSMGGGSDGLQMVRVDAAADSAGMMQMNVGGNRVELTEVGVPVGNNALSIDIEATVPATIAALLPEPTAGLITDETVIESHGTTISDSVDPRRLSCDRSWSQDRINQRPNELDCNFDQVGYGAGVHVGLIDTGIDDENDDFAGRMGMCETAIVNPPDAWGCRDDHGHGTHVAGTMAGFYWGIAKQSTIHSCRGLQNGSGADWQIILCIDKHILNYRELGSPPYIVNESIGGTYSDASDRANCRMIQAGIMNVVAAGNEDVSLCHFSPARVLQAVTTGATHYDDSRTYFSSHDGNAPDCKGGLDIFAPGWNVVSDKMGGCPPQNCPWMSGTSMAAPHAAGAAAVFWGLHPDWDQFQVIDEMKAQATPVVTDSRSESNLLVYVGPDD